MAFGGSGVRLAIQETIALASPSAFLAGPEVLLAHADGTHECLESPCLPFGIMDDAIYEDTSMQIREGDHLLLFSDGAVEVHNADGQMLDIDGLIGILEEQDYPTRDIQMSALEEELLKYSDAIRIDDDLTFIEIRFNYFLTDVRFSRQDPARSMMARIAPHRRILMRIKKR